MHDALASDVQNRYLLSYTPPTSKRTARGARSPSRPADATNKVRAASGYFAPKPPPVRPSIEFTVTDAERRLLDVDVNDLVVTEDGVEQTVETFQEAVTPVSIILALDASGSMKKSVEAAKAAATSSWMRSGRRTSSACSCSRTVRSSSHDLGTERDKAQAAIAGVQVQGRHGAVRRARRFARSLEESGRPARRRRRHRRPRRRQPGHRPRQRPELPAGAGRRPVGGRGHLRHRHGPERRPRGAVDAGRDVRRRGVFPRRCDAAGSGSTGGSWRACGVAGSSATPRRTPLATAPGVR